MMTFYYGWLTGKSALEYAQEWVNRNAVGPVVVKIGLSRDCSGTIRFVELSPRKG